MAAIDLINFELINLPHLSGLPNDDNQFAWGAAHLITDTFSRPKGWGEDMWRELCGRGYGERLAIAGALVAIALDKHNEVKGKEPKSIYNKKGD